MEFFSSENEDQESCSTTEVLRVCTLDTRQIQDFNKIQRMCERYKPQLFEDPWFPCVNEVLGKADVGQVSWLRPKVNSLSSEGRFSTFADQISIPVGFQMISPRRACFMADGASRFDVIQGAVGMSIMRKMRFLSLRVVNPLDSLSSAWTALKDLSEDLL